jgi:hypothetical protein
MKNRISYFISRNFLCPICTFLCVCFFSINANAQQAGVISSPIKVLKVDKPAGPPERVDPPAPIPTTTLTESMNQKVNPLENKPVIGENLNNSAEKKIVFIPNNNGEKKVLNKAPINLIPPVVAPPITSNPNSYSEEKK